MNYLDEFMLIYDECMAEIFSEDELDEDDKLDFDLIREGIIVEIQKEIVTKEDEEFFLNNLDLYKRLVKAMLIGEIKELKLVLLEMLKKKRQSKIQ